MTKKNLIVFDIDDTLTLSETQHQNAYVNAMKHFGIEAINQDWKTYTHHTDSYILKENYERNFSEEFSFSFIPDFEKEMVRRLLLLPETKAVAGAGEVVRYLIDKTSYAVCFATGSLLAPALIKLEQATIPFVPELVSASNAFFERENIVKTAIQKAIHFYKVTTFDHIISVGDGIWDTKAAHNLGLYFIGIGEKNLAGFKKENIRHHIKDWQDFDLQKAETQLGII